MEGKHCSHSSFAADVRLGVNKCASIPQKWVTKYQPASLIDPAPAPVEVDNTRERLDDSGGGAWGAGC